MRISVTVPCTIVLDIEPDQIESVIAAQLPGLIAPRARADNELNTARAEQRRQRVARARERIEHDICDPLMPGIDPATDIGLTLTQLRYTYEKNTRSGRTAVSEALEQLVSEGRVVRGVDGRYRAAGGRRSA